MSIKKPKMILFDNGQTLMNEEKFDFVKGYQAVLELAVKNPDNVTAAQIRSTAKALSKEIGQAFITDTKRRQLLEIPAYTSNRYLFEYLGLEFDVDMDEVQWAFSENVVSGYCFPTKGVEKLLNYLWDTGIRTAVVSNLTNSTVLLERRIKRIVPENHFEFFIASSDYVFRKPHKYLFDLAVKKSKLFAEDIWFCGDSFICDVQGSYQAGMNPIWYTAYMGADEKVISDVPHHRINDWDELIRLIEAAN